MSRLAEGHARANVRHQRAPWLRPQPRQGGTSEQYARVREPLPAGTLDAELDDGANGLPF
jgi:hypothetical protein